jgi:hypothetical protein
MTMRILLAFAVLLTAGCHQAPGSAPSPSRCKPAVPTDAQHPIAARPAALAGDYELIQVRTQSVAGVVSSGRLHLAALDSATRAGSVGGAVRDLVGWLELAKGDTAWTAIVASRDPAHPGAVLAGQHLWLGRGGDLEGYREHLTITAVDPQGFWGWWKAEPGLGVSTDPSTGRVLADPAGYFCALRVRP